MLILSSLWSNINQRNLSGISTFTIIGIASCFFYFSYKGSLDAWKALSFNLSRSSLRCWLLCGDFPCCHPTFQVSSIILHFALSIRLWLRWAWALFTTHRSRSLPDIYRSLLNLGISSQKILIWCLLVFHRWLRKLRLRPLIFLYERFSRPIAQVRAFRFSLLRWWTIWSSLSGSSGHLWRSLVHNRYFWLDGLFMGWLNLWPFLLVTAIFNQRFWISIFQISRNRRIQFRLIHLFVVPSWRIDILVHKRWLISILGVSCGQRDRLDHGHSCRMLISRVNCFFKL